MTERKSKNALTVEHLEIACRHVKEMMTAGVTENLAIRTLETFTDIYAKRVNGGKPNRHRPEDVELWSKKAMKICKKPLTPEIRRQLRVEHGTPRRALARLVLELYTKKKLNEKSLNRLAKKYWKLAVITIEEDRRLSKIARSTLYRTPEERWAAARIVF